MDQFDKMWKNKNKSFNINFIKHKNNKIYIKSVGSTNQIGWNVSINGEEFFFGVIDRELAEKKAYYKWINNDSTR